MLKFGLKQYAAVVLTLTTAGFAATAFINQVGYRAGDVKEFALVDGNGNVEITDASGTTVLTVTPKAASHWDPSDQNVQLVDFSELNTPGTYSIKVGGQELRKDLKIAASTYEEVAKAFKG